MSEPFTKIPNDVLDAMIRNPLGNSTVQIFMAILRKTLGWQKAADNFSISQLSEITGCPRRTVIYGLQNLEAKNMIIVKRRVGRGHVNEINAIGINLNTAEWVVQENAQQYSKALKQRRDHYKNVQKRVVQEGAGSARNGKKSAFSCTTTIKRKKETSPLTPQGDEMLDLKDFLKTHVPIHLESHTEKIMEFFDYRQKKPKAKRYSTIKGIQGLFRDLANCQSVGFDLETCLDIAMERDWQTPSVDYFKKEMFQVSTPAIPRMTDEEQIRGFLS
jgi:phage replication O-like protein O